jgi:hypothetical protein
MPRTAARRAVVGGALILGSTLGLAGCRTQDASDSISTLTSWAATVRMAGEGWVQRQVPTPYTRRTLEAAAEGIADTAKDLAEELDHVPAARAEVSGQVEGLRQAVEEARSAVEREDRGGLAAPLARIAAAGRALAELARRDRKGSG